MSTVRSVLVTGATGFLGSAVVTQLSRAGARVRASGRSGSEGSVTLPEYVQADLEDVRSVERLVSGMDAVVHCAGLAHRFGSQNPEGFVRTNVWVTSQLLRAATRAGVRRVVLISSVAVYGRGPCGRDESAPCHPDGVYAESKLRGEKEATELARQDGLPLTILRMPTLYGRGDPGNVARLVRLIARGRFVWIGSGTNRKSLLHRDDAAGACVLAVDREAQGCEVFNIPADVWTMGEIVKEISLSLGRQPPRVWVPARAARIVARVVETFAPSTGVAQSVEKWLEDDVFNGRRFSQSTGFAPSISFRDGIREEVAWIMESFKAR